MDKYQSKYNKIVMDNQENSPNSNMVVRLTLEQYYDLLHHTHKISDIIGGTNEDGSPANPQISKQIEEINKKIEEIKKKVNNKSQGNILNVIVYDKKKKKNIV